MSDQEWVRVRIKVDFGWVGTEVTDTASFDRADWDEWSDEARADAVKECVDEIVDGRVSSSWEVVGSDGDGLYTTDRTLADALRGVLTILDRLAPGTEG